MRRGKSCRIGTKSETFRLAATGGNVWRDPSRRQPAAQLPHADHQKTAGKRQCEINARPHGYMTVAGEHPAIGTTVIGFDDNLNTTGDFDSVGMAQR
jgi:hypothetical protein